jgi:hypothetical protein
MHPLAVSCWGSIPDPTKDTSNQHRLYPIPKNYDATRLAGYMGFKVCVFDSKKKPKLRGAYDRGEIWIYDPEEDLGSFRFQDWSRDESVRYTRNWRITHELGHALTEGPINMRYGRGRRAGKLGDGLEPREVARALAWEHSAFHKQRFLLLEDFVVIDDDQFAQEYRVNMADAFHRVLTGEFSNPGREGFVPRPHHGPHLDELCSAVSLMDLEVFRELVRWDNY